MKLECLKNDLEHAVDTVSRIVSHTATLPVLRCVVFEAQDTSVLVKATNLELGVEKKFAADVKTKGIVAIPAQTLLATLKASPQQTKVTLEVSENTLTLTISGSKTTIKTISPEDFPNIPKPETKNKFSIEKEKVIQGVKSVVYSASTSLIKPELASVYMYQEAQYLVYVATDSFRLAEKKIEHKTDAEIPDVIMPVKNTIEFIRILEAEDAKAMDVYVDENQYSVITGDLYITSRIIDGSFPDYRSILPKETSVDIVLLKEDLVQTLKKAQIFSDKFGQITFHISPEKKTLTISAQNNDVGEIYDSLEAVIKGADLDISFNHRYLSDMFQSIKTDSINLVFAGVGRPLVAKGVGDSTFTYLVMPMNR